jgi:hypothetical protein
VDSQRLEPRAAHIGIFRPTGQFALTFDAFAVTESPKSATAILMIVASASADVAAPPLADAAECDAISTDRAGSGRQIANPQEPVIGVHRDGR